jgi:hypothetical protein
MSPFEISFLAVFTVSIWSVIIILDKIAFYMKLLYNNQTNSFTGKAMYKILEDLDRRTTNKKVNFKELEGVLEKFRNGELDKYND